jgi:DNA topoisomerase-1
MPTKRTSPKTKLPKSEKAAAAPRVKGLNRKLVIVESPAKAKTIGRYLGADFEVKASMGHVRDLPGSKIGVDFEKDFAPVYVIPKEKKALIKELTAAAEDASELFLATDPDREGEAIAWHLYEAMDVKDKPVSRVVFHEITEPAIKEAFSHPRKIDAHLVDAQQTRRILDRLVGYKLSPLLWSKLRGGLSAGRVQSAALRMLVDREREIEKFIPQEYWRFVIEVTKQPANADEKAIAFQALLKSLKGQEGKLEVRSQAEADAIRADLDGATYVVAEVTQRESKRRPPAPFTTSTLQQDAVRKIRFSARATMAVAQQLYEGLSVGTEGVVGLITYMRTDSPVVSAGALTETRDFIGKKYGADFVPESPRTYVAKAKGVQEAHEAIRPTVIFREPPAIKHDLHNDQFKLYDLIWKRMVASQMADAIFDATTVQIEAQCPSGKTYIFEAKGQVEKFHGFLALYSEGKDATSAEDEDSGALPAMAQGEALSLLKLDPQQKFTQPPPRYSEASLIKAMEENGIGRPSTYAPTISTLYDREYIKKEGGTLRPQQIGRMVDQLLEDAFPTVVDLQFTARMEEELDEIADGEKEWVPVLREFYDPFHKSLELAKDTLQKRHEMSEEKCALCGSQMVIKSGRFGRFLACIRYPECKGTKPFQIKTGVKCPLCTTGDILEKKSRKGKRFYGCSNYFNKEIKCTFAMNLKPLAEPCPNCGSILGEWGKGARCTKCDYKGKRPSAAATPAAPMAEGQTPPAEDDLEEGAEMDREEEPVTAPA